MSDIKGDTERTSAPKLEPFDNDITATIRDVLVGMAVIGLILLFAGSYYGVLICGLSAAVYLAGDKEFPTDPRTGAILTHRAVPINDKQGRPIVVGGRTILMNWFPFYINAVPLNITNINKDFDMTIMSSDGVRMKGRISVTYIPNARDGIDYMQSTGGAAENVHPQLEDIFYTRAQEIARGLTTWQIATESHLLANPLHIHADSKSSEKQFGILIKNVKARFDLPDGVVIDTEAVYREGLQRKAEMTEYQTNMIAAKYLLEEYQKSTNPEDQKISLKQCMEQVQTLRNMREGRISEFKTTGKTVAVVNQNQKSK